MTIKLYHYPSIYCHLRLPPTHPPKNRTCYWRLVVEIQKPVVESRLLQANRAAQLSGAKPLHEDGEFCPKKHGTPDLNTETLHWSALSEDLLWIWSLPNVISLKPQGFDILILSLGTFRWSKKQIYHPPKKLRALTAKVKFMVHQPEGFDHRIPHDEGHSILSAYFQVLVSGMCNIVFLNEFWGGRTSPPISPETCRWKTEGLANKRSVAS